MKKIIFTLAFTVFFGNMFANPTWDILDKSMAQWNVDEGADNNKSWASFIGSNLKKNPDGYSITQEEGFVNLTKTHVEATASSAMINSAGVIATTNTPYSIEFKVRINPINKTDFPDIVGTGWELNLISARVNKKTTDIYLGYAADGRGYITLKKGFPAMEEERVYRDISDWHIYSFMLSADNKTFDVYVDGELIFENAVTADMNSASNILRVGTAVERARCNIDLEYAKMGTGDFYSKPRISSVTLSSVTHVAGNETTVSVTANTSLIDNGEKLLFSFVDGEDTDLITPVEAIVTNNTATSNIIIPATVSKGEYAVKVSVVGDQIGEVAVTPKTIKYEVTEDFGTSIQEITEDKLISISGNVLSANKNLLIQCHASKSSLSEITLHNIIGSEVYRKSVSGNEYTLQAPTTSGIYVLRVSLSDNTSRTFKVLVK